MPARKSPTPSLPPNSARQNVPTGWRVATAGAVASVSAAGISGVLLTVGVSGEGTTALVAVATLALGELLIRGAVAYGATQQARWSAWVGGAMAVASLPGAVLMLISGLTSGDKDAASMTAVAAAAPVLQAAGSAAFLAGLLLLRAARKSSSVASTSSRP